MKRDGSRCVLGEDAVQHERVHVECERARACQSAPQVVPQMLTCRVASSASRGPQAPLPPPPSYRCAPALT